MKQAQDIGTAAVHNQWRKGLKGRPICVSNGLLWNIEAPSGLPLSCLQRPYKFTLQLLTEALLIAYSYFDLRST